MLQMSSSLSVKAYFLLYNSRYLSFSWLEKCVGNVVDVILTVTENVDGRDSVSGSDNVVSGETYIGSFTRLGHPMWKSL